MKLKKDEIGIRPASVDLLIMNMIKDVIKKGTKDNELLDSLIDNYNSTQISYEVMLKLFFDYCKEDFNIRSFLINVCKSELCRSEEVLKNDFHYPILKIRYSYFEKIIFSELRSLVSKINNNIDSIDAGIEDLTYVKVNLPMEFYDIDGEDELREFESEYDKYDSRIRRLKGRKSDLKSKIDKMDSLKNYRYNEKFASFSSSVYEHILICILDNLVVKDEDFYNLFLKISEKSEYQIENDEFKSQMIERLISFADTCEVSLDRDYLGDETKIKKLDKKRPVD